MPPKKKEEVVDLSTLPPWFALSVYMSPEASEQNGKNILKGVYESNFSTKKLITREEIIDYGKKNGLYLDPLTDKQPKKDKNAPDIPTELTPELLAKMFLKYYEEINLEERKEKKARLDAIAEGKDPAQVKKGDGKKADPKAQKDQKKGDKKDPKAKAEEEEQKEEPPLDTLIKKECDFIYFLVDYPTTKDEMVELSKQGGRVDLVLGLKENVIEHKSFMEETEERRDDDEEVDEQARLEEAARKEKLRQEHELKLVRDREYKIHNLAILDSYKAGRKEAAPEEPIRNTMIKQVVCEFDDEKPVEETLKEITVQIYTEICNYSQDVATYREWIQKKKTYPIKQYKKVQPEPPKPVEPVEGLEDTTKSPPKGQGKADARPTSKEAAKDAKKDPKKAGAKKEEEKKEEAPPPKPEPPKVEEKEPEFSFNFYEKQLIPVKEEHLTPGALLEAIVDEINHSSKTSRDHGDFTRTDIQNVFRGLEDEVLRGLNLNKNAVIKSAVQETDASNPERAIINEGDSIAIRCQDDQLATQENLEVREHLTFDKIKLPGFDRNDMPPYPEKSEPLRKAEKCQIHPFLSFEITDYERFQFIELFEKMFQERTGREWNFGDRIYEERFNANILRQRLYQSLLFDPEVFTQYHDKDDALMLGTYHVNPPGRVVNKKWTSPWKVLPNIENWVLYFKENENNFNNNLFYNLDYQIVENLHEIIKFMYPNDLSVIMCSQFKVGDHPYNFYRILKENFTFGIRKSIQANNPNSELWAVFENRTKLLVEVEKLTEKGILADEEKKAVVEASQKLEEQKEGGETGTQPVEEAGRPETAPAPEPENYGATFTLTLENGLIAKFLTNGDILQTIMKTKKGKEEKYSNDKGEDHSGNERSRLVTGKGSVIRYMKDGSVQILYSNGNFAVFRREDKTWITTNNKGLRKGRRLHDNSEFELDRIPSAKKTDPETGCKILIREDKVMVIDYPDGTKYTTHRDGTKFLTSADANTIIIEHKDFATVRIKYDPEKAANGTVIPQGNDAAALGFEDIIDRSCDGRVTETLLPDGSKVVGLRERRELGGYGDYEESNIHLLYEPEGSVLKFKSTGEVVLISANDRYELNKTGENREKDDIDYFLQLFGNAEERKNGVYTAELAQNVIWTRDNEGNHFTVSSSGEARANLPLTPEQIQNIKDMDIEKLDPREIPDGIYFDPENAMLPAPQRVLPPKLFIIKNNNTGSQYISPQELGHFLRLHQNDPKRTTIVENNVPGFHNCQSLTYLTSFSNYDKDRLKQIFVKIPPNVDIIPKVEVVKEEPMNLKFLYRNLLRFTALDETNRQKLHEDLDRFNEWKKNGAREIFEFGIKERPEEVREKEFQIQRRIVESRRTTIKQENYEDCLYKIMHQCFPKAFEEFRKKLIDSRKRKDPEPVVTKKRKSVVKKYPPLEKPPALPEEIYPLGIRFSEADWRDVNFVGNYYQTYPGAQFEKILPRYDVQKILEEKEKLRKTQNMMQTDENLREGARKYSLPRSNVITPEMASGSPVETKKEKEFKSPTGLKTVTITPSWNMTRDRLKREREEREEREAQTYHATKEPKFDLYGQERKEKPQVSSLYRPEVPKELNTKHIAIESATDRRVRIVSMAPRLHLQAPSVEETRNQGTHTLVQMSLDRKYNLGSLQERKDLMITAEFADPLKRDLLINPPNISFGRLKYGTCYEKVIAVKNEDALPQRIHVEPLSLRHVTIKQKETGPIAMGVTKYLIVTVDARKENVGSINCELKIKSKHDIYYIKISGEVVDEMIGENEKNKMRSKLAPLNPLGAGTVKVNELSDSKISQEDTSFPTLRYDRNTKLDMNLHNKKKNTDDSYLSENANM